MFGLNFILMLLMFARGGAINSTSTLIPYDNQTYESHLGLWHSQYMEIHKIHVPNHQPVNGLFCCVAMLDLAE